MTTEVRCNRSSLRVSRLLAHCNHLRAPSTRRPSHTTRRTCNRSRLAKRRADTPHAAPCPRQRVGSTLGQRATHTRVGGSSAHAQIAAAQLARVVTPSNAVRSILGCTAQEHFSRQCRTSARRTRRSNKRASRATLLAGVLRHLQPQPRAAGTARRADARCACAQCTRCARRLYRPPASALRASTQAHLRVCVPVRFRNTAKPKALRFKIASTTACSIIAATRASSAGHAIITAATATQRRVCEDLLWFVHRRARGGMGRPVGEFGSYYHRHGHQVSWPRAHIHDHIRG